MINPMNPIDYNPNKGMVERVSGRFYGLGRWLFEDLAAVPDKFDRLITEDGKKTLVQRLGNAVFKPIRTVVRLLTSHDYSKFPHLGRFKLASLPGGPLLLILYPFTIGSRLVQAIERAPVVNGRKKLDEVGDVLRRDVTAISLFVFALEPFREKLLRFLQKNRGVELFEKNTQGRYTELFSYEDLSRNYYVANAEKLQALMESPNRKALIRATGHMETYGDKEVQAQIQRFRETLQEWDKQLVAQADPAVLTQLRDRAFSELEALAAPKNELVDQFAGWLSRHRLVPQKFLNKVNQSLDYWQGYKGFFSKYARTTRLPVDIIAFALVCLAIGFGPVKFNDYWSKRTYARRKQAEPKPTIKPASTSVVPGLRPMDPLSPWGSVSSPPIAGQTPFHFQA